MASTANFTLANMVSNEEKSAAVKELLRRTLRAWHESTKEEARAFVAGATVDTEQELETEVRN